MVERRTLYKILDGEFVDIERRGDALVLRRGDLNGRFTSESAPAGDLDALVARYRTEGFQLGSPWGFGLFGNASRQLYKNGEYACFTTDLDALALQTSGGERWFDNRQETTFATADELIAHAEALIAERERAGFTYTNFELLGEKHVEVTAPYVPSATPYDAVDNAVARLRELTRAYPSFHFLVEEVSTDRDAARLDALGYGKGTSHGRFFQEMNAGRFDRWRTIRDAPRDGSSWTYFVRRYVTLTWIIDSAVDNDLPMFYCGNVSGGGWSALELGEGLGETHYLADDRKGHGYESGVCFHGGWGRTGYFFDTRQASADGEYSIYPFTLDGPQDEDPPLDGELPDPTTIEPFGFWLERNVHEMVETLRPRLAALASD